MSDRSEADCASNDLVERVARRLCNTAGSNWHAENFNQTDDGSDPEDQREYYRMLGRAAIAVVLEQAAAMVDRVFDKHVVAAAIRALAKQSTTEEGRA